MEAGVECPGIQKSVDEDLEPCRDEGPVGSRCKVRAPRLCDLGYRRGHPRRCTCSSLTGRKSDRFMLSKTKKCNPVCSFPYGFPLALSGSALYLFSLARLSSVIIIPVVCVIIFVRIISWLPLSPRLSLSVVLYYTLSLAIACCHSCSLYSLGSCVFSS